MGLDDFVSDDTNGTKSKSKTKTKTKKSTGEVDLDKIDKSDFDMIITNPKDPRYEVDGIEHLGNVLVTFDTEEHPSGIQHNAMLDKEEYINKEENMTKGSNTVKITEDEFKSALDETGMDFEKVDYHWACEIIYEANSKNGTYCIRVYSTIDKYKEKSRDTGEDSIKINVIHNETGQPLFKATRTYRIPTWKKNLKKKIKEVIGRKDQIMICNKCGNPMVVRENSKTGNKFYGCTGYPDCKNTMSIGE